MVSDVSYSKPQTSAGRNTGNRAKAQMGKEAIRCALNGDWDQAVAANRQILDLCPTDCEASNRLSKALMELGNYAEARLTLERLVEHSPQNVIARKNLTRLDQLENRRNDGRTQASVSGKSAGMFVADSGRSCTTTLSQQAGPSDTASVSAGDVVILSPKSDGVIVNAADGRYLGRLQRRLGRRLSKLMAGGNRYEAAVAGLDHDGLSVIVRETRRAPALRNVVSFPAQVNETNQRNAVSDATSDTPLPEDEADAPTADAIESEDGIDPSESALMELPDETPVEAADMDEVPTLDTDNDPGDWQPVAPASPDDEDWD